MQCPFCAKEVPAQSRYCLHCGSILGESPSIDHPTIDGFSLIRNYIPRDLAERILTAGKQIESERRLVTILFADVTGFTALSEKLDPEDVTAVLNDCFTGLISTILRYEGTIDKFIGDGIMAIFGAPLAHENDPERAVRCALDMVAEIELFNVRRGRSLPGPLGLHIGLHSGMVIAGNVGNDLRMNYSVIGDTVNLASRLVEMAPRGEIYLSSETYKLVAGVVDAEGPVVMSLRGKTTAATVYKLKALRLEHERRSPDGFDNELVGREEEVATIGRDLDRVEQGAPVRLLLRGEPGVGKSRLTAELVKLATARGIHVVYGSCSSFETTTPYYVWSTLLRNLLQLRHDADEDHIRARLQLTIVKYALQQHEPYLATLLSIRYGAILLIDEQVRKQRIFDAVRALLAAAAGDHATVFVLEDLHWIDPFSQEFLESCLTTNAPSLPGMYVLTCRDEYPYLRVFREWMTLLDLNRLDGRGARALMLRQLDADSIPPAAEEFIMNRSEGNPFFIQEIIKTLLDSSKIAVRRRRVEVLTDNIEAGVPSTIQGIIMARIDRLQDHIKEVLFGASAIGREFSRPLLEQVVAKKHDVIPSLHELRSLELVLEKREFREFEYLFKHFLIQEVAYNTMLINKRKELHASIAAAIEKVYSERLVEYYELLAFHYEKAEMWDKAAEYLSRSGHKVRQMYTRAESESFFARKADAVRKLYQSTAVTADFSATLKAILPPLLVMLVPIVPMFVLLRFLLDPEGSPLGSQIALGVIATVLLVWYSLALWYLGVVPFLRGNPRLYDLMEDRVRVLFKDRSSMEVHFSEIERLRLWDAASNKLRPLRYRLLDPLGRVEASEPLTLHVWVQEVLLNSVPPYSFGVGSGAAEIHLRLNGGYTFMRIIFPWLNTPLKSRTLSLHPFDTKEFYVQFEVALLKWWKQQKYSVA